jgi:hypothetical protein
MTNVDLAGIGVWCEHFGDWEQFCAVVRGDPVETEPKPKAERIPPRDRRRAPLFVRMAVEVMDQACRMAKVEPSSAATVFGSSLGDVQITDYMCRTVAGEPRSLSPTRFHNSVHNASTGYWSIATESHAAANAVSAYDYSPAIALLEGAIQAIEERLPVLVAFQEMAATATFESIYPSRHPLAVAMLLMPGQIAEHPLGHLSLELDRSQASGAAPYGPDRSEAPLFADLEGNFAASMLGLLRAIAGSADFVDQVPVSAGSALTIGFSPLREARRAQNE